MIRELEFTSQQTEWIEGRIISIYFGGGTPSLMPPDYVDYLINEITNKWNCNDNIEITLEANPTTRDTERFKSYRQAGVNRLSIGAQSFIDDELRFLGRNHNADDTLNAVSIARQVGFDNISLDLIYGVPGQTVSSYEHSVKSVLELGVEHLSTYTLSIEPSTPFERFVKNKRMPYPDTDLMADQYQVLIELMKNNDYDHYELTNYCLPERWSRHNYAYWDFTPYVGLGCGAHSFDGLKRRYWNSRSTTDYIKKINANEFQPEGEEILSDAEVIEERFYLGLRCNMGISDDFLHQHANKDAIKLLTSTGFILMNKNKWIINEKHWLNLDDVVLRLLAK